jgi:hypothetical protein
MTPNSASPRRPRITVLTPVYNDEQTLQWYAAEVTRVPLNHPDYDFTVLFIDAGSVSPWPVSIKRLPGNED